MPSRHNLAVLLEQLGRFEEAIRHYEVIRGLNPVHVRSIARLVAIRPDDTLVKAAEELLSTAHISDGERIRLNQALGKYFDRQSSAFRLRLPLFQRGQGHRRGSLRLRSMRGARGLFRSGDRRRFRPITRIPARGRIRVKRPVFILGSPRSGAYADRTDARGPSRSLRRGGAKGLPMS